MKALYFCFFFYCLRVGSCSYVTTSDLESSFKVLGVTDDGHLAPIKIQDNEDSFLAFQADIGKTRIDDASDLLKQLFEENIEGELVAKYHCFVVVHDDKCWQAFENDKKILTLVGRTINFSYIRLVYLKYDADEGEEQIFHLYY